VFQHFFRRSVTATKAKDTDAKVNDTSNTPRWPETEFLQPLDGVGTGEEPADCGYFSSCSESGGSGGGSGISVFGFGGRSFRR